MAQQETRFFDPSDAGLASRVAIGLCGAVMLSGLAGCLDKPVGGSPQPLVDPGDVLEIEETTREIDPAIPALTINKEAQVSVLGYHDFINGRSPNPMMINIDKFRSQMQALKDAHISVIGFDEFFAWRRGERDISDPSVLITIDDGWRSTYQLAWPVLKEFGYPFTVYLYKNYVSGGGRALTVSMIEEMVAAGVEIGSHTVSHPLRKSVFAMQGRRTEAEFAEYLRVELQESKRFLEDKFGIVARTFAYPGGIHTDEIVALCDYYGYEASITCNPSRTTWDTPLQKLNRYIIHGNNDLNFETAMRFRKFSGANTRVITPTGMGEEKADEGAPGEADGPRVTVRPAPGSVIADRRPRIEADLSEFEGEIVPDSIELKLSGLGDCPVEFDPVARLVTFQPRMAIRRRATEVSLSFRRVGEKKDEIVAWQFEIELKAAYFPRTVAGEKLAEPAQNPESEP